MILKEVQSRKSITLLALGDLACARVKARMNAPPLGTWGPASYVDGPGSCTSALYPGPLLVPGPPTQVRVICRPIRPISIPNFGQTQFDIDVIGAFASQDAREMPRS